MVGRAEKIGETPHDVRRGRLKNGNPPGDFRKAPRCGARNRRGLACQCPSMRNGRCRLHGGLSTGARTAEGLERIRRAATKHGRYSKAARAERRNFRVLLSEFRGLLGKVDAAVEGLYRARDSAKASRLLARLTPEERQEVFTRVGERIERDKARFSQLLAKKITDVCRGFRKRR